MLLKKHISIQSGVWDVTQPGFIEADTAAIKRPLKSLDFATLKIMTRYAASSARCAANAPTGLPDAE